MSQRKARSERQAAQAVPPVGKARAGRGRLIGLAIAIVLAVAALIGGIVIAHGRTAPAQATPALQRGPDGLSITGSDPVTGRQVSLASYAGKPIVLNVWGSWCPGCNQEAADLARFAAAHPEAQVIGIDLSDSKSGARSFYQRWGWHHPSIYDPNGDISSRLGLQGTPTTFFLDRRHRIVSQVVGATNLAGFEQGLKTAVAKA